jgi:hypothetical protein
MLTFAIIIETLKNKHGDKKLALTFVEKGSTLGNLIYNFYIKYFKYIGLMFELPRPTICLEINIKDIVKSFNFKPWK